MNVKERIRLCCLLENMYKDGNNPMQYGLIDKSYYRRDNEQQVLDRKEVNSDISSEHK